MENETKVGYISGGVFFIVGILMTFVGFDSGWTSGKIVIVIGLILDLLGLGGLLKPNSIGSILAHYLKNVANDQERVRISQKQNKSFNSSQTGIVHGGQYNYYSEQKDKISSKKKVSQEKIRKRLKEIKLDLEKLKKLNNKEGHSSLSEIKIEVKGIIHKIYAESPDSAEKRLIQKVFWMITGSTTERDYQDWYLQDIDNYITTINVINREMDLE